MVSDLKVLLLEYYEGGIPSEIPDKPQMTAFKMPDIFRAISIEKEEAIDRTIFRVYGIY